MALLQIQWKKKKEKKKGSTSVRIHAPNLTFFKSVSLYWSNTKTENLKKLIWGIYQRKLLKPKRR